MARYRSVSLLAHAVDDLHALREEITALGTAHLPEGFSPSGDLTMSDLVTMGARALRERIAARRPAKKGT